MVDKQIRFPQFKSGLSQTSGRPRKYFDGVTDRTKRRKIKLLGFVKYLVQKAILTHDQKKYLFIYAYLLKLPVLILLSDVNEFLDKIYIRIP